MGRYSDFAAVDINAGLWADLLLGFCTGVLELAKAERERLRRTRALRQALKALPKSLNPAPTPATVASQWLKVRHSPLEALRFGSLLLDLEPTIDRSLIMRPNRAGTRNVIVARNAGLKGWLHRHCPEIGYRTALRHKNLAERLRNACGLSREVPVEWALPDPALRGISRKGVSERQLQSARSIAADLLGSCRNVARLQAALDTRMGVTHRRLATPRKGWTSLARKRRAERRAQTLLRHLRARYASESDATDTESRVFLLRGLVQLADDLRESSA